MQVFRDAKARSWDLVINVTSAKRLKAQCGVDLNDASDEKLIRRLIDEPMLLADCLFCLCEQQAKERSISAEDFGEGLGGAAIDAATKAFLDELIDFFPKYRREATRAAVAKYQQMMDAGLEKVKAKLQDPRLEQRLMDKLDRQLEDVISGD